MNLTNLPHRITSALKKASESRGLFVSQLLLLQYDAF